MCPVVIVSISHKPVIPSLYVKSETENSFDSTCSHQVQGNFCERPAEGAMGSNVIIAFVAGVMVTAQKR